VRGVATYFGSPRAKFGWVHTPSQQSGIGLVIVPPFGYEAICAHRALRHLAEAAADAGLLAIRFDPDGTGDSAGDDLEHGRVEAWLASVDEACDLARARGADRIVLAGVRLGAALATIAAERRNDIAGIAAIAPVTSGKAYARELKMLQGALGLAPAPRGADDDVEEALGFALTPETRVALSGIDLVKAAVSRPARAMLVIDRDDLPASDKWIGRLRELGVEVEHARLPGYVDMVVDPHKTVMPGAIIEAVVAFASRRAPREVLAARPIATALRCELGGGVVEQPVQVDEDLFAIATHPATPVRRAVVLLNSGAIHRIGPNRLYVALARRLAARGELVVRADLSGIGDSRPKRGTQENLVYNENAVGDVAALVAWAKRQGAQTVVVGGVCSGAYHAIKAATVGQPIDAIIPVNPLTFYWKPDTPLDAAAYRVASEASRYKDVIRSRDAWKKLLRGDVHVRHALEIVARRARDLVRAKARDVLRDLRVPLEEDLGSDLLGLARRKVAVHFVFAASDPGCAMLHEQGGSVVAELSASGRLAIDVIEGPDHTFTARWTHPLVLDAIERAVSS